MTEDQSMPMRVRWARLRFQIVGPLLASPPEKGDLEATLMALAERKWRHPTTEESLSFSFKTIERWYYAAREASDPIGALERKVPKQAGTHPSIKPALEEMIRALRAQHPGWSNQLLHDNLVVQAKGHAELAPLPGYATLCRFLRHHGLGKRLKPKRHELEPGFERRERRLYEVAHVCGLWHCDFHDGKRKVLAADGKWRFATLFAMLDDRSRLCCHAQWYLGDENTESFVHGLCQGFLKRGLPRALISDNGGPMIAAETEEGLERQSILHPTTLAQTPEQNGKQEVFWAQIEGRLMPMLEGEAALTLELLNRATQAWVEQEYNQRVHSETKQTPIERWQAGPSVVRPCPSIDDLRRAFRMQVNRQQRISDGTLTFAGVRYEIPSAYRTLIRPTIRVARWDLSSVELVDPRHGTPLATLLPVDRAHNAERCRRVVADANATMPAPPAAGIAPLLQQLMADYAATGLPPAYIPHDPTAVQADEEIRA